MYNNILYYILPLTSPDAKSRVYNTRSPYEIARRRRHRGSCCAGTFVQHAPITI